MFPLILIATLGIYYSIHLTWHCTSISSPAAYAVWGIQYIPDVHYNYYVPYNYSCNLGSAVAVCYAAQRSIINILHSVDVAFAWQSSHILTSWISLSSFVFSLCTSSSSATRSYMNYLMRTHHCIKDKNVLLFPCLAWPGTVPKAAAPTNQDTHTGGGVLTSLAVPRRLYKLPK